MEMESTVKILKRRELEMIHNFVYDTLQRGEAFVHGVSTNFSDCLQKMSTKHTALEARKSHPSRLVRKVN